MKIFALDSSGPAASAAVMADGKIIAECYADVGLTHSETLMELCDEVFRRTSLRPDDIDIFAADTGPGSFTGLRIGIGILKGLAYGADKKCVAVPTCEALAYGVRQTDRFIVPAIDARRGRVYAAVYEPYTLECISEVEVRDISELGEWLSDNDMRVIFVGDGAEICYNKLNGKIDAVLADPTSTAVHAAAVALCAGKRAERCEVMSASDIAPMYLQPSQAERERLEKIKKELN